MDETRQQFEERAERLAIEFCARYGVTPANPVWSDEQIEQALRDHDLPPLHTLARIIARERAMHLLAHKMLQHPQPRCRGCIDWGTNREAESAL